MCPQFPHICPTPGGHTHRCVVLRNLYRQLQRRLEASRTCLLCVDCSQEGWPVVLANEGWTDVAGECT